MRRILLSAIFLFSLFSAYSQTVVVRKVELQGEKVIVHYDLEDSNPNNEYLLNLFSSKDNFTAPLSKVTGDVGPEIKPGTGKKIEWLIRQEYGGYKGRIALEIRGRVYVPFVKLQDFDATKGFKRGKSYNLAWKVGGTSPVHIELFRGSQRVQGDLNQPNNGNFILSVPSKVKPGKEYRIKFTDSKDGSEIIYSPYFKVKPKIPLWAKIAPVAIIGGVVAILAGGKSGKNPEKPSNELPTAPDPN
jgi:hypothetical protein